MLFVLVGDCDAASPSFPASFSDASHLGHWLVKLDCAAGAHWPSCGIQHNSVSTCSLVFSLPYTCAFVVTAMLFFHAGWFCVHGGKGKNGRTWKGVEIRCLCGDGQTVFVEMQRSRENNGKVSVVRQRQRLDFKGW